MYEHEFIDGFKIKCNGRNLMKTIGYEEYIELVYMHGTVTDVKKIK